MRSIKKWMVALIVSTLSIGIVGCSLQSTSQVSNTQDSNQIIIAMVGEVPIYKSALDQQMSYVDYMLQLYDENYKENDELMAYYTEQQEQILEYLIEVQVLVQKAESLGLDVSEEELEKAFEDLKLDYETEKDFNDAVKASKMTLQELKDMLREDLIVSAIVTKYTENIIVSDEEIETYYNENKEEYIQKAGAYISQIVVATEEEANKIRMEYENGTSFESLVEEYSTSDTKDYSGDLGYVYYEDTYYEESVIEAIKSLKDGEVSEPIKTKEGWQLLLAEGVVAEDIVPSLEDVYDSIYEILLEEKEYNQLYAYLDEWKTEFKIQKFEDRL